MNLRGGNERDNYSRSSFLCVYILHSIYPLVDHRSPPKGQSLLSSNLEAIKRRNYKGVNVLWPPCQIITPFTTLHLNVQFQILINMVTHVLKVIHKMPKVQGRHFKVQQYTKKYSGHKIQVTMVKNKHSVAKFSFFNPFKLNI